jgi:hypothetical protein
MKIWTVILGLATLAFFKASAQVSVQVLLDQNQFLPGESLPVTVHIINRSGQTLHLGADPGWLSFSVEAEDGSVVAESGNPPVLGKFDLGSSQMAIKQVDIAPYFALSQPGPYHVIATVRIKAWNTVIASPPKNFDIIHGAKIWSQTFGMPMPTGETNGPPPVREYSLIEANYLRLQLRMYVQVSDASEDQIFKVRAIGPMVSFSQPEAEIDRLSDLHILYQSSAFVFTYAVVDPSGSIVHEENYDYVNIRPRLRMDEKGNVTEYGGVRRVRPDEITTAPPVKLPNEVPAPATNP